MPGKFIAICVPSRGVVSIQWSICFTDISHPLNVGTVKVVRAGLPAGEARNWCVAQAFNFAKNDNSELTHIFWLDDDVLIHKYVINQLYSRKVPIVAGPYFTKCPISEPVILPDSNCGTMDFAPDSFLKVYGVGFGCCLIHAEVFTRMEAECDLGKDQFGNTNFFVVSTKVDVPSIAGVQKKFTQTEDIYFLDNARKLGYDVWLDSTQYAFGWHFDYRTQKGYPEKQFAEWEANRTVTWDTPAGPVVWRDR